MPGGGPVLFFFFFFFVVFFVFVFFVCGVAEPGRGCAPDAAPATARGATVTPALGAGAKRTCELICELRRRLARAVTDAGGVGAAPPASSPPDSSAENEGGGIFPSSLSLALSSA